MAGIAPRPCPFCGHTQIQIRQASHVDCYMACDGCSAGGPSEGSEAEAILAWNTRRQERCAERCELQKAMDEFVGMNPPIDTVPAPVQWAEPTSVEGGQ